MERNKSCGSVIYVSLCWQVFNGDISSRNERDFYRAESFNRDLSLWDVSRVGNMDQMLRDSFYMRENVVLGKTSHHLFRQKDQCLRVLELPNYEISKKDSNIKMDLSDVIVNSPQIFINTLVKLVLVSSVQKKR
jgi:Mycoplasma protein of unknown function, DUF285